MTTQPSNLRACLVALEAHLEVVRAQITVLETAREALYALAARAPSLVDPTPRRVKRRPRVTRPRLARQRRGPRATPATARRSAAKARRSPAEASRRAEKTARYLQALAAAGEHVAHARWMRLRAVCDSGSRTSKPRT